MKPDTIVELHNKGKADFKSQWDGKPFVIKKGKHKEVVKGLADHFIETSPDAGLVIELPEPEEVEVRDPVNPLEDTNRGKAFEGLE